MKQAEEEKLAKMVEAIIAGKATLTEKDKINLRAHLRLQLFGGEHDKKSGMKKTLLVHATPQLQRKLIAGNDLASVFASDLRRHRKPRSAYVRKPCQTSDCGT